MAILTVILGAIALHQIGRRGERGKGLAIGGFAALGGWVVVGVLGFIIMAVVDPFSVDRDPSGEIVGEGSLAVDQLRPGDCLKDIGENVIGRLDAVPCGEPHLVEVYAVLDVTLSGGYPGEDVLEAHAADRCVAYLEVVAPAAYDDSAVDTYHSFPAGASWRAGYRQIVCYVFYLDGPRTGSVLG